MDACLVCLSETEHSKESDSKLRREAFQCLQQKSMKTRDEFPSKGAGRRQTGVLKLIPPVLADYLNTFKGQSVTRFSKIGLQILDSVFTSISHMLFYLISGHKFPTPHLLEQFSKHNNY